MEQTVSAKVSTPVEVRRLKVTIGGEPFTLVSDEPEEVVQATVQEVNNLMDEVARHSGITDMRKVAVLVALQCASRKRLVEQKLLTSLNSIIDSI